MIQDIIDKNSKEIVAACQEYLNTYAAGIRPLYATDIDLLLEKLDALET